MPKKTTAILISLIVIFIVGYILYSRGAKPAQAPAVLESRNQLQTPPAPAANPPATPATSSPSAQINLGSKQLKGTFSSGEGQPDGSNIAVAEIDFDGSKFVPSSVDIKVNDYVFFKNKSTADFWPASNPHPFHTDYPAFDSKQNIAPGGQFKFQFTKAGHWGFHDHLNSSVTGVVNVTQ